VSFHQGFGILFVSLGWRLVLMKNIHTPHSIKLQSNTLVHGRAVLSVSARFDATSRARPEIIWAAQQRSLLPDEFQGVFETPERVRKLRVEQQYLHPFPTMLGNRAGAMGFSPHIQVEGIV
jgi:hypothetical protein